MTAASLGPTLLGSLALALLGVACAAPVALGIALFLRADERVLGQRLVRILLQASSAIPTVVWAVLGFFLVLPTLQTFGCSLHFSLLLCVLLVAGLICPTLTVLFEEKLRNFQKSTQTQLAALGITPYEGLAVFLPQLWPDLLGCCALGFARAVGDTMIALLLSGNAEVIPTMLTSPFRTLPAHITLLLAGDLSIPEARFTLTACIGALVVLILITHRIGILLSNRGVQR